MKTMAKDDKLKPRAFADGIPVYCTFDEIVDVLKVVPRVNNPNMHPQSQVELGARIIKAQGWRAPIIISKNSGFITKGHGRLLFALHLGVKEVPVEYQEYENDAMEMADVLADNELARKATTDTLLVQAIMEELTGKIDLELTAYDMSSLSGQIDLGESDIQPPAGFSEVDEDLECNTTCPKCGYQYQINPETLKKHRDVSEDREGDDI
jgi:hypothetical protein